MSFEICVYLIEDKAPFSINKLIKERDYIMKCMQHVYRMSLLPSTLREPLNHLALRLFQISVSAKTALRNDLSFCLYKANQRYR